ncbi:2,3-diaminopropionate biosynthesis protein SbnB [Flavitalea sp. BT771]|uniref:2,3-diaminopropionate biosynthesis protein SbnB n=1 Tax=Flavitalea sp. BT771 TaxID=3063329 RepID=UPI0026E25C51|nr:2,3-diaminopropionate biosynthesis protein SbnB [Flavitalea sp. BT771]MDO6428949.1 2,3-diaminopropionate biosynthesis protein SbnB [Flavitalea sp. BT771]MDV6218923.1 2,3-diaminopropionate biosynthesis protein SbnB [Flavitalea sp. BT771]
MRYLNEEDVLKIGIDWPSLFEVIESATAVINDHAFSQPVKPYLRYKDPRNRIIAMPAYVGGGFDTAGIKWIASFPGNIKKGIPRAHSVMILNESDTGKPYCIFNTGLLSGIRTASVTGSVINKYLAGSVRGKINFGMIGYGFIGRLHLSMIMECFEPFIDKIYLYDLTKINEEEVPSGWKERVVLCPGWEDVFDAADVFITCTVSESRYIDRPPIRPSLHLNVSLRDYTTAFMRKADLIIVDNWEEVCRENTDIECMHREGTLDEGQVHTIIDVFQGNILTGVEDKVVMFNPMGMAVYDMAIARHYWNLADKSNIGVQLA